MEDEGERINHAKMKNSSLENHKLINKLNRSICKIDINNKYGSGFLIKLKKGKEVIDFLITNEHVIDKNSIKEKKKFKFNYDSINDKDKSVEIQLNKDERFIRTYGYMNVDATLVQILSSDNIDKSFFLESPKLENIKKYKEFEGKKIRIPQFPRGGDLQSSKEKITGTNIYRNEIYYEASTEEGSSGSPIFLENSEEVIGIHKQAYINKNKGESINIGSFLAPIIESLINDNDYEENYVVNNNEIYEGEMNKNKLREGYGKYTNIGQNYYYIGQWLNNDKHGNGVKYDLKKKIIYEGGFDKNKYHGKGILYDKKVGKYDGDWENDVKKGKGKQYDKKGILIYDGEFKNDKYWGQGIKFYEDGEIEYEGEWENGMKNGDGKKYYEGFKDKIEYMGEFNNDKFHGFGTYYDERGYVLYNGEYKNSKKNGKGIQYYEDEENIIEYEGNFNDDKFDGYGVYYYKNGNQKYNGNWKNHAYDGIGTSYYENMKKEYEGHWSNGKKKTPKTTENQETKNKDEKTFEKETQYYNNLKNTKQYEGGFDDNEYNGEGILYYESGKKKYEGYWRNGKKNCKKNWGREYYDNEKNTLKYEGNFDNDEYYNKGTFYYETGEPNYKGEWSNGKRNGEGIEYFNITNKKQFVGKFRSGKYWTGDEYNIKQKIIRSYESGKIKENNGCFN